MEKVIDLNADVGESYGHFNVGQDEVLMPYLSSCNIACGFHGGDPATMMQTLLLAKEHQVRVGAHPGFPDLRGFGRQAMAMPTSTLMADTLYQVSALRGMAQSLGIAVAYVKPHGALYHHLMTNDAAAEAFVVAVRQLDPTMSVFGLPDSALAQACAAQQVSFEAEGFLDRAYLANGSLAPRSMTGSVIQDPSAAAQQLQKLLEEGEVDTLDGETISLTVTTLCLHGDNPQAVALAQAAHQTLQEIGWNIKR